MNDQLACITNYMPDIRSCTVKDQHDPHEMGELGPVEKRAHLDTCNGCQPRLAHLGLVCTPCASRIDGALHTWEQLSIALRGIDRAITPTGDTGSTAGPRIPIAPVPLTMDELWSFGRTYHGDLEHWVSTKAGARDAVQFARAVENAARQHPIAETTHSIPRTRCPECGKITLTWTPPQFAGGDVIVACRNQWCRYEADQSRYEDIADIEAPNGKPRRAPKITHERLASTPACTCAHNLPTDTSWLEHVRELLATEAA